MVAVVLYSTIGCSKTTVVYNTNFSAANILPVCCVEYFVDGKGSHYLSPTFQCCNQLACKDYHNHSSLRATPSCNTL